jgi:cell division protein FtsL
MKSSILNIIYLFIFIIIFFYLKYYITNLNTDVKDLKHDIELREAQNDSIAKKLDSIAIKKVEVTNRIDNRSTTINNLQESLNTLPTYDTSLTNAVMFLHTFGNKQLNSQ